MMSTAGAGAFIIIGLMAVVTLITRYGGVLIMSFIPISPRVESFINAMSGSVLVAILVPIAVEGDLGARLALVATGVVMLVVKKPMAAIAAGLFVAAATRWLVG
ncbi:MAG: AzlD family protein [Saccharospirillum sp.]